MVTDNKQNVFLNVFLIKKNITNSHDIIHEDKCDSILQIPIAECSICKLYIRKSSDRPPNWSSLFSSVIEPSQIGLTSNLSAAFLISVQDRIFAIAFGPGGRFLIKNDVFEERFGLISALNSVDKKTFRCIDKQSFDTIQSHTRIQSSEASSPDQFGFDVEKDILKAIVGTSSDTTLGSRMTGMDSLVVSVRTNLNELPGLIYAYKTKYEQSLNNSDYQWINNIAEINGPSSLIDTLDKIIVSRFVNDNLSDIWISIPEIIQWDYVRGFIYRCGKRTIHHDVSLEGFLSTVRDRKNISINLLKTRRVYCADADHNPIHKEWSIYKCIYAEVDYDNDKFILSSGKWFRIDNDFVNKTNSNFNKIPRSSLKLPNYNGGSEGDYNYEVSTTYSDIFCLMDDKKKITHGGGSGQVELCDLLSINKEIIHIKKYGQSKVFSHLFSQGFVSGQLLQLDSEFREKVIKQMKSPFSDLIRVECRPHDQEFTIVYGIISDSEGDDLNLPFFSRVNLNNVSKSLKGFGYKVELLKIKVDQMYSKTKIYLPSSKH